MKLTLLATIAALALPGLAQAQITQSDPSQAAPMGAQQGTAPMGPQSGTAPMGGYQPNGPAMQGTMQPGVQPVYQPAPSPSQAYPAPAPMANYPMCKKGQYDGCMERENAAGQGIRHPRRK